MSPPKLFSVTPSSGPTGGGALVRIVGTGFGEKPEIRFGGVPAILASAHEEAGTSIAFVRTPPREAGLVSVELGSAVLPEAYRYARETIAREATLTRLVRKLLRELKKQVLANVSMTVSVDYDDTEIEGMSVISMATLPSVVLSGPNLRENRLYSTNVLREQVVGGEVVRHRPPLTVDLLFTITAASEKTAELLNLMAAVATFVNRNRWLELLRDPGDATQGVVRWEMVADGELRTQLEGKSDVRAFSWGLVVRGFDVDEGLPFDATAVVDGASIQTVSES